MAKNCLNSNLTLHRVRYPFPLLLRNLLQTLIDAPTRSSCASRRFWKSASDLRPKHFVLAQQIWALLGEQVRGPHLPLHHNRPLKQSSQCCQTSTCIRSGIILCHIISNSLDLLLFSVRFVLNYSFHAHHAIIDRKLAIISCGATNTKLPRDMAQYFLIGYVLHCHSKDEYQ